jgi:hypothetical protein
MPTVVLSKGLVLTTKPLPESTRPVNWVPVVAVGRLARLMEDIVARADWTVILNVTTRFVAGVPDVSVTVPVRTWPGLAAAKAAELNVTSTGVPKL